MSTQEVLICDTCGKGFETHMALIGHMGYHKNSGRYKCELCALEDGMEVVFSLPQGLGAHMRAKHNISASSDRRERNRRYQEKKKQKERIARAAPVLAILDDPEKPPAELNGSGEIGAAIALAFAPLEERYLGLQQRQSELAVEQAQVEHDLKELWAVLQGRGENLTPPPNQGVQVGFQKQVSDSLTERAEEWLRNRRTGFTVADLARGLATSNSTAAKLIALMRDEGKLRLVGKKRQANAYASTISGG